MTLTTTTIQTSDATIYCQWCGNGIIHSGKCPNVKSLTYDQYGQVTHVEFFDHRKRA